VARGAGNLRRDDSEMEAYQGRDRGIRGENYDSEFLEAIAGDIATRTSTSRASAMTAQHSSAPIKADFARPKHYKEVVGRAHVNHTASKHRHSRDRRPRRPERSARSKPRK